LVDVSGKCQGVWLMSAESVREFGWCQRKVSGSLVDVSGKSGKGRGICV